MKLNFSPKHFSSLLLHQEQIYENASGGLRNNSKSKKSYPHYQILTSDLCISFFVPQEVSFLSGSVNPDTTEASLERERTHDPELTCNEEL